MKTIYIELDKVEWGNVNSTEEDKTFVPNQRYDNIKIIMTGTIVEFILYKCGDFRFWHLLYTALKNMCMFNFFCSILHRMLLFS